MPAKKRPNIGRSNSRARKVQDVRNSEAEEERRHRLEILRTTASARRDQESRPQRQSRLDEHRQRTAQLRDQESQVQRQSRLDENRQRTAQLRDQESQVQSQSRLDENRQRTAQHRRAPFITEDFFKGAFSYRPDYDYAQDKAVTIGAMSVVCQNCQARKWKDETKGMCCSDGKVKLPLLNEPPQPLKALLLGATPESKHFLKCIRSYNSSFQMTSFGANIITEGNFMPTFKVQGQVYHRIGSLQPLPNEEPQFLQLYFVGNLQEQAQRRSSNFNTTRLNLVLKLQEMVHTHNSYVRSFKYALECAPTLEFEVVIDADKRPSGEHSRRFNAPACNEVAVIMQGEEHGKRDIVLKQRDNTVKRISELHRSYDALQYPLLHVQGEDGYQINIKQASSNKTVSCKDFYAYHFMVRDRHFNHMQRSHDLFHQYAVDMFAKMEAERLAYIRNHQKELRVDSYIHLRDGINNDGGREGIGQLVILPSSFTGSPRYMHERTQDAMTFVRYYGRPDLFITFTCNPNWPEITQELFEGQTSKDRHDLIARVFRLKVVKLMKLIKVSQIFGPTRCDMYTIEWQKRGLPHAHILIWLCEKVHSNQIDSFISAEIPNPIPDPLLHATIKTQMIHGPCGALNRNSPCMTDGKCTKNYPRPYRKETETGGDGYPEYQRRSPQDGGFTAKLQVRGQEIEVDNRWVVPYCPLLSKTFNAHINVEFCNSVKSIKYICKYVNKGSDAAMFGLHERNANDEITQYQLGRYISSNEVFWRFFGFPIHERHPAIEQLSVHLENGQRVYFTEQTAAQQALAPKDTTLTAFFKLCQQDTFAKTLFYHQVPSYYTWNTSGKKWNRRKRGQPVEGYSDIRKDDCLGRVYTVHPSQQECFYLRLLLHDKKGPTSFEDLRRVDEDCNCCMGSHICQTYREACFRRGLLTDDTQWNNALSEAAVSQSPHNLRVLFAVILQNCDVSNPIGLWETHKEDLSEDYKHQVQLQNPGLNVAYNDEIFNMALSAIEDKLLSIGGKELHTFGLPQPNRTETSSISPEVLKETSYNVNELAQFVDINEPKLLDDQRYAYSTIIDSVKYQKGGIFFLNAPGGTGKTFVTNLLLAKVRQQKKIALAVASSGIAATLLPGGRTAHATFKLPLNLATNEQATCSIGKGTGIARLLKMCWLIVWDECTMSHKAAFHALDRTLQDIRECKKPMGGVTLVLSGDFRQTLPVIPRGTRADELKACLKSSYLWRQVSKLHLSTNMRAQLQGDTGAGDFSNKLLLLGDGKVQATADGTITMNPICTVVASPNDLKTKVFPNIVQNFGNHKWLCERAILAPKNVTVKSINSQLLTQLPGAAITYKSIDTVPDEDQVVHYPTEFLNSLEPPGVPPHKLELKVGTPIMLLRNMDPPRLCNGTRLVIKTLMPHVLEATILSGCGKGDHVFIPRIPIIPSDMPFDFKRLQFPVRLSFAMSINKSQGQTLKVAGLHLEEACFSHGQLYVGCSRVGSPKNLFLYAPEGKTKNVVYQEALR